MKKVLWRKIKTIKFSKMFVCEFEVYTFNRFINIEVYTFLIFEKRDRE